MARADGFGGADFDHAAPQGGGCGRRARHGQSPRGQQPGAGSGLGMRSHEPAGHRTGKGPLQGFRQQGGADHHPLRHGRRAAGGGLVFDISGSMGPKLRRSRRRPRSSSGRPIPRTSSSWWNSTTSPSWWCRSPPDAEEIQNQLTFAQSKGRTALLDAIMLALHEMKKSKKNRKALLIISDGGDNSSRYTETEVRNLVRESDVLIYAIGVLRAVRLARPHARGMAGPGLLNELARADRRPPIPRGGPGRDARHRRQDRHRDAQPLRAGILAHRPPA